MIYSLRHPKASQPRWHLPVRIAIAITIALLVRLYHAHHPASGGMLQADNLWDTVDWLAMEMLDVLENKTAIAGTFSTMFQKDFEKDFPVGEVIRVPKPPRYLVTNGLAYQPQAIINKHTTITVDQPFGIHFEWDSFEQALKMGRTKSWIREHLIEPAGAQLAQEYDSRAANYALLHTPNIVGTLGANPTTFDATSGAARQILTELACPRDGRDRCLFLPPGVMRAIKTNNISLFNPVTTISKMFKDGILTEKADSFDWYESMSIYSYTADTWAGAVTINGANQQGTSINVTCTNGDTFSAGTVISLPGCFPANPSTRRQTQAQNLKTFVLAANTTGAANAATLTLDGDGVIGPGDPFQNVTALPTNGGSLVMFPGTTSPNGKSGINGLAMHPLAFGIVGIPLPAPKRGTIEEVADMTDPDTGFNIRFTRTWDPQQSKFINRMETCIGFGGLYPENCSVRVLCG